MSENNDYIQLPPLKKDTPSDVVAFMWEYIKVPEDSREKVKNLLKDANENVRGTNYIFMLNVRNWGAQSSARFQHPKNAVLLK